MIASDLAAALDPVVCAAGLGFEAEPWQSSLLRTREPRVLVRCARQTGKSTTCAHKALHTARFHAGRDVLVISPTQRQSDELLIRVRSLYRGIAGAPLLRDNASELMLPNRSRIVSLPGSEGGIRGFANVKLLLIDEASRVEDDVYVSSVPMVGSDGQVIALSTPWGQRGWWWQLHDDERNGWERISATVYESAQYSPERIAQYRASMGRFEFASDYECDFTDTSSQLFKTEHVRAAFSDDVEGILL